MDLGQLQAPLSLAAFHPLLDAIMMPAQRLFPMQTPRSNSGPAGGAAQTRDASASSGGTSFDQPSFFASRIYRAGSSSGGRPVAVVLSVAEALPPVVLFQNIQNFPGIPSLPVDANTTSLFSKKFAQPSSASKGWGHDSEKWRSCF